jgi:hypothetical protein
VGANSCSESARKEFFQSVEQQLSLACGHGALSLAAPVIAQGNIHKDAAAGGFEADDESFGILAAFCSIRGVENGGMDAEMESLIVESGNGISCDLIRQLAHSLAHQSV